MKKTLSESRFIRQPNKTCLAIEYVSSMFSSYASIPSITAKKYIDHMYDLARSIIESKRDG